MAKPEIDLSGRIVVVGGAAGGGLGTTVARLAAEAGATVIGASRDPAHLEEHLGPLAERGLAVVPVVADLETDAGVEAVMAAVDAAPGVLHGLVSVVGGGPPPTWGPSTRVSRKDWRALFSLNLESMFFLSAAVAERLQREGRPGSLVAISSVTGVGAQPYNIAYGAAKSAILAVVRTLALELASKQIRVNAIAPGAIASPVSLLPPNPELEAKAIPMGRKASVKEVAGTALFLLSDTAAYMTGQCLVVDGGISLKWSHLNDDNTPLLVTNADFLRAMKGE